MNKKVIIITIFVVGGLLLLNTLGKNRQDLSPVAVSNQPDVKKTTTNAVSLAPADTVEVVNFFGTQRCASCIAIGTLTRKTLDEKFHDELESGKIVFKEINGELPKNRDVVIKYQARGSSLFINATRGQTDQITEDITVWRLVNNEEQYIAYLENKINTLLGK